MTEDREGVHAKGAEPSRRPVSVRTGEAARMLQPAAGRLGLRMDRQEVRRLCNQQKLVWDRIADRGWRLVSVASIEQLIADYTAAADRAENPDVPTEDDAE